MVVEAVDVCRDTYYEYSREGIRVSVERLAGTSHPEKFYVYGKIRTMRSCKTGLIDAGPLWGSAPHNLCCVVGGCGRMDTAVLSLYLHRYRELPLVE